MTNEELQQKSDKLQDAFDKLFNEYSAAGDSYSADKIQRSIEPLGVADMARLYDIIKSI